MRTVMNNRRLDGLWLMDDFVVMCHGGLNNQLFVELLRNFDIFYSMFGCMVHGSLLVMRSSSRHLNIADLGLVTDAISVLLARRFNIAGLIMGL